MAPRDELRTKSGGHPYICRVRVLRGRAISAHLSVVLACGVASPAVGCSDGTRPPPAPVARPEKCVVPPGAAAPDFLQTIGCRADFEALASAPLDASIPGARSVKFVVDLLEARRRPLLPEQQQVQDPLGVRLQATCRARARPVVTTAAADSTRASTPPTRAASSWAPSPSTRGRGIWALEIAPYDMATRGDGHHGVRQDRRRRLLRPGDGLSPHLGGGRAHRGPAAQDRCAWPTPRTSTPRSTISR